MNEQRQPRARVVATKPRWTHWVKLGAEAAAIVMNLRDNPRRLDWVAVGIRAVGLAAKIRAEHRAATAGDPCDYFVVDGPHAEWIEVPMELVELLMEHVEDLTLVESHHDGEITSSQAVLASLDGHPVGWVAYADGSMAEGPYIRADAATQTWRALGDRLWRRLGTEHAHYGRQGLTVDALATEALPGSPTPQFEAVQRRLEAFLDHGIPRSVLFCGPPGTGKSTGIRHLTQAFGLRSLRVDVASFVQGWGQHRSAAGAVGGIDTLIRVLRPEVVVLDDIDRTNVSARMLEFLEFAHTQTKLLFASANQTREMAGAALRPGRFDEVVRVDRLDPELLEHLLGGDAELAAKMVSWPVAYVREYLERRRVLGREAADAELEELSARVRRTGRDDD